MDDKSTVATMQDALSAKVAEVQRLGSALAARVRYAQVVKHPIPTEKLTALILAARLLKEYEAPWPPLMKQVLNEFMLHSQ
jgi:hypothetical protein